MNLKALKISNEGMFKLKTLKTLKGNSIFSASLSNFALL